MFKDWGTWFGTKSENGQVRQEGESIVDVGGDKSREMRKPTAVAESEQTSAAEEDTDLQQLLQKAKGFSGKADESGGVCDRRPR